MSDEVVYHKFAANQTKSGLIPPVDPYEAIARRVAEGVAMPTRPAASIAPPALTKPERIEKARAEAKVFLADPEMDHNHLAFILSLRWEITRQEAAGLLDEVRQTASGV